MGVVGSGAEWAHVYDGVDLGQLSDVAKIQVLQANEDKLGERKEKERRPILRMKGITQSYYMYDSLLYKNSKSALEEMLIHIDNAAL